MNSLPLGKLRPDLLKSLLSRYAAPGPRVVVGPAAGEDAAVVDAGESLLILTADPITFATERLGWYAVHVNANDVAAMGGTPLFFLTTLLLPANQVDPESVERVFREVAEACREIGCVAVGGHTEVTSSVTRPVLAGAMVGETSRERLRTSGGARAGDMLVLAKGIAIEATALLAHEKPREVERALGADFVKRASGFLDDPGISVLPSSRALSGLAGVHALHDVTEGGLATALRELAEASSVGLVVSETEIPRYWESVRLAELFQIDLLGAIGSGALLIAASQESTDEVLGALDAAGVTATVIGRITERRHGMKLLQRNETTRDLPRFDADELTRVL